SDELAETGRLVKAAGTRWSEARLDQRDLSALRAAADEAYVTFGRVDILFANAGIQAFKAILDWQDADWHDTIDVNLTGTCNAIRAVAPHLVKNGGGRIIVTASTQGRHGTKYGAVPVRASTTTAAIPRSTSAGKRSWAAVAFANPIRFRARLSGPATPGQVRSARAAAGSIPIVFTTRRRRRLAFCIGMRETFVTPDHRRPLLECGAVPGAVAA